MYHIWPPYSVIVLRLSFASRSCFLITSTFEVAISTEALRLASELYLDLIVVFFFRPFLEGVSSPTFSSSLYIVFCCGLLETLVDMRVKPLIPLRIIMYPRPVLGFLFLASRRYWVMSIPSSSSSVWRLRSSSSHLPLSSIFFWKSSIS